MGGIVEGAVPGVESGFDPSLTRATLLKAGGAALLAAAIPGGKRMMAMVSRLAGASPAQLRRSTYLPHVGTTFGIRQDNGRPLDVKLRRIGNLSPNRAGSEHSFSLLFTGPRRTGFAQDARLTVTHRALGRFQLAVIALGARKHGQYYEAIVNRRAG